METIDGALDARGLIQAKAYATQFANEKITTIISSSMQRCPQTVADLAAAHDVDIIIDEYRGSLDRKKADWAAIDAMGLASRTHGTNEQLLELYADQIVADRKQLHKIIDQHP